MSVEALDNISCPIEPLADSHLANKAYVDAAVASGAGTASVSGDNIVSIPATSLISCGLAPTEDSHLVNKAYVDAAVAAAGSATPIEEPAALGPVVYVDTLSDAADHTGTSLRDAITGISTNGSVVIKFSVSGTITLQQGEIAIKGNITIDGDNKITINANSASRHFTLATKRSLRLHNIILAGGNGAGATLSKQYGGSVYIASQSFFSAYNTTFQNNVLSSTSTSQGGGVFYLASGAVVRCIHCNFFNNGVTTTSGSNCYGGVGYITNGEAWFDDCLFRGNYVINNKGVNTANAQGGAINQSYPGAVRITNCTFDGNSADSQNTSSVPRCHGGAIYATNITVDNCEFINNFTQSNSASNYGGAIFINASNHAGGLYADQCVFRGNSALYGGAVYATALSGTSMNLRIIRSVFDGNVLSGTGSRGVALYAYFCCAVVEDCHFSNNQVGDGSGVIYVYGYTDKIYSVTVNRCKFTGNSTTATTNGLIYCANNADVYVYNSVFTGNSAGTAGVNVACLYTTGTSSITAGNLTITNNEKLRSFRAASGSITIYNSVDVGNVTVPTMTNVVAISPLTNWSYGTGRIAYDSTKPLFAADGYTPVAGSQVIDAGDDDYVETVYDLVGKARVSGASVDVGAVEWQGA